MDKYQNVDEEGNPVDLPHLVNPKVWYRHPLLRIFIAFMVLIMDFLTYGEDPINDSHVTYNSVGVGQIAGPLAFWYAPRWYYALEKLLVLIVAVVLGVYGGQALRTGMVKARINCFRSDGGLVTCVVISYVAASFILDMGYNASLDRYAAGKGWLTGYVDASAKQPESWDVESHSMQFFKKVFFLKGTRYVDMAVMWQTISSAADWLAIYQLVDSVFQDKKYWPEFMPGFKEFYLKTLDGKLRLYSFWILLPLTVISTSAALRKTGDEPGQINWELQIFGSYNEITRAIFAGLIVGIDLFFVVQDVEFPLFGEFQQGDDVDQPSLAGTNSQGLKIHKLTISARWLQYGPIFLVMTCDFLYLKSMYQYTPQAYGQYVNPANGIIYAVTDETLLDEVYPLGTNTNATLLEKITYEARRNVKTGDCLSTVPNCISDVKTTSMYHGTNWDYLGVGMGLCAACAFLAAIFIGSRQANERCQDLAGFSEE